MTFLNKRNATRLQTLSLARGILPLTALLAIHLWVSSASVSSRDVYDRRIALLHGAPWTGFVEATLVFLPLAYLAITGVQRALRTRKPDEARASNVALALQRVSGAVVFVFIAAHLWEFRGQTWIRGLAISTYSTKLAEDLSTTAFGVPWIAFGYLVACAATFFSIFSTFESGYAAQNSRFQSSNDPRARRAHLAFGALAVVGFSVSASIVVQLATGSRYLPTEDSLSSKLECGPGATMQKPPTRAPALPAKVSPAASAR